MKIDKKANKILFYMNIYSKILFFLMDVRSQIHLFSYHGVLWLWWNFLLFCLLSFSRKVISYHLDYYFPKHNYKRMSIGKTLGHLLNPIRVNSRLFQIIRPMYPFSKISEEAIVNCQGVKLTVPVIYWVEIKQWAA